MEGFPLPVLNWRPLLNILSLFRINHSSKIERTVCRTVNWNVVGAMFTTLLISWDIWTLQNIMFYSTFLWGFLPHHQIKDKGVIYCSDIYRQFQRKTYSTLQNWNTPIPPIRKPCAHSDWWLVVFSVVSYRRLTSPQTQLGLKTQPFVSKTHLHQMLSHLNFLLSYSIHICPVKT